MKPTLTVLSGLSASGKSTLAAKLLLLEERGHVLCSDAYHHCYQPGQDVTQFLIDAAFVHLSHGIAVIVDAVNRHPGDFPRWRAAAHAAGVTLHWVSLEVPIEECVSRDAARTCSIGEAAIRAQETSAI